MSERTERANGLSHIQAVTFDCFGTLIDWPRGLLGVLRPLAQRYRLDADDHTLLSTYAKLEREAQSQGYRTYRDILRSVSRSLLGSGVAPMDAEVLANSIGRWQPFADVLPALRRLGASSGGGLRLGVLSNIDDDLFEPILSTLENPFAVVVTAQQVSSYKPNPAHFQVALQRLGLAPEQVLHVAESRYHDIEPASAMGMPNVWVDRGSSASGMPSSVGMMGSGAPSYRVNTLSDLVGLLGL